MPKISVIIPCRDEADTLWFTINSLQMHTRGALVERDGLEIIVADNDPGKKTCGKTVKEVAQAHHGRFPVRYIDASQVKSPYYPRMAGAEFALGEHLIFLDAHVLLSPFTIEALHRMFLKSADMKAPAQNPSLYMAHIPVSFDRSNRLFGHYALRLRDDFWGAWQPLGPMTWNPTSQDHLAPIGAAGIWCFSTSKESWKRVGGFNPNFRGYAGGEVYLQLKYWLLGGHVFLARVSDGPGKDLIHGVHWSAPRRYATNWRERVRNVLLGVSVVAPELLDAVDYGLQVKSKLDSTPMADLRASARQSAAVEAAWMKDHRVFKDVAELEAFWTANQVLF